MVHKAQKYAGPIFQKMLQPNWNGIMEPTKCRFSRAKNWFQHLLASQTLSKDMLLRQSNFSTNSTNYVPDFYKIKHCTSQILASKEKLFSIAWKNCTKTFTKKSTRIYQKVNEVNFNSINQINSHNMHTLAAATVVI